VARRLATGRRQQVEHQCRLSRRERIGWRSCLVVCRAADQMRGAGSS